MHPPAIEALLDSQLFGVFQPLPHRWRSHNKQHGDRADDSHPELEVNPVKPNDIYIRRTAALTSRRYISYIYSTNIHTEYFKHAA